MNMFHWLEKRAALTPDRIALIGDSGESLTFGELRVRALGTARKLYGLGVQKGDFVAFLCMNGLHVPELVHGLHYLGAVIVPLNTRLTASEISFQLQDAGCRLLIYDDGFESVAKDIEAILPYMNCVNSRLIHTLPEQDAPIQYEINTEDLHTVMYTSGTTGKPKGVLLSWDNHWASAIGSVLNLGLTEQDRWLASLPLFHISGLSILMKNVIYGMTVVIHRKFDPVAVNRSIREEGVTIVSVVSAMLARCIDALGDDTYPEHFRCALLGGGPAPLPLLEACTRKKIPVYQTYGMTETSSQIVTLSSEYMLTKLGSAGKPLFHSELRIVNEGKDVLPNTPGEIVVRGPAVTRGYLNRPEASREAIRDGWLYTGDIGYVDEEGFLYVLDRRTDLIISGGENVYPAEIEAALLAHPAIEEAGVTGGDDPTWGQVPIAFVKAREGMTLTEEEVRLFCAERLAKYKIPAKVYFVDALPRNASNKLLRKELKKMVSD